MTRMALRNPSLRRVLAVTAASSCAVSLAACNRGRGSRHRHERQPAAVGVSLITKDSTNPFFVAMQKGAKADAAKNNVKLTVASGKQEGDDRARSRPSRTRSPAATRASSSRP